MIHYMTTQGVGQPWVGNELRVVGSAGVPFVLHAMRPPQHAHFTSEWALEMDRATRVLYPIPPVALARDVLVAPLRFGARFWSALGNALFAPKESLRARLAMLAHLAVACHWAVMLRDDDVSAIHAQWAHSSASIAMYGAWLLGVPFSFTGHATDLFRHRVGLRDKIRRASFIGCISRFHRDFFRSEGAREEQLRIVYCGVDVKALSPSTRAPRSDRHPTILSAGRLVEKKGFEYLIDAVRILTNRNMDVRCVIRGSGPLDAALQQRIDDARVAEHVTLVPKPLTQEELPAFMAQGDVFCLPCVWASDDDVDGLPQMLMEAMACGVPAVSTRLVGIPDLVEDEVTGLLAEPRDAEALANCLERILEDAEFADRVARAGREHVERAFDIDTCLAPLIGEFRRVVEPEATPSDAPALPPAARRGHRAVRG